MKNPALILAIFVLFTGCKKESSAPAQVPASESATIATVYSPTLCNGFLSTTYYITVDPDFGYSTHSAQVFFSKESTTQPNGGFLGVNKVSLNEDSLMIVRDIYQEPIYYWQNLEDDLLEQTWSVNGKNGVPSFSFTNSLAEPAADFYEIPDTLKASHPVIIINSVSNIQYAFLGLSNSGGGTSLQFNLRKGKNMIRIPLDQLKKHLESGPAKVFIVLENYTFKNFSGQNFKFSKYLKYDRSITLEL